MTQSPPKRRAGRPRDAGAAPRILAAARAVAGDVGIHRASMSAIADRSAAGKPTIYLRWPDLRHVIAAAIDDLAGEVAEPPDGTFRVSLLGALIDDREALVTGPESRFLRSALFESATDDLIAEALERSVIGPRRERLRRILERGVRDGAARDGLDPGAFAGLLVAALMRAMALGVVDGTDDLAHHADLAAAADGAFPPPPPEATGA